jgi:hypothetical protein
VTFALLAALFYSIAMARAVSFHSYPSLASLLHPFENWRLTLGICCSCLICCKAGFAIFRQRSVISRAGIVLALTPLAAISAHFVLNLAKVVVWAIQELIIP